MNIETVIEYFTGGVGVLPPALAQIVLEFSGCLKVGRKSLVFMTYNMPAYKGWRFRKHEFENRNR